MLVLKFCQSDPYKYTLYINFTSLFKTFLPEIAQKKKFINRKVGNGRNLNCLNIFILDVNGVNDISPIF